MPELTFQITGVEPTTRGLAPLLGFNLKVANKPADQLIHAVLLSAQIQFQCPQRNYSAEEKEKLVELFGPPEMWGQSLRNRVWAQSHATICAFRGEAEAVLDVPCTFDLNITATKYIYALDEGDLPLLFLFSGSVFYESEGHLKVEPISWDKECLYQMRVGVWKDLMQHHYPNTSWLYLQRDVFDRLYAFKRQGAFLNWEQTIESLLDEAESRNAAEHTRCMEVVA
jgi:hypothetical protein